MFQRLRQNSSDVDWAKKVTGHEEKMLESENLINKKTN